MKNKIIKNFLESIETKLCINEINKLLYKEKDALKKQVLSIQDLLKLESTNLRDTYNNIYIETEEFSFKDFQKMYFLIQNFKYNMFLNKDIRCFFENSDELINEFIKEDMIGLNSILEKFNKEFNIMLMPETILIKQEAC